MISIYDRSDRATDFRPGRANLKGEGQGEEVDCVVAPQAEDLQVFQMRYEAAVKGNQARGRAPVVPAPKPRFTIEEELLQIGVLQEIDACSKSIDIINLPQGPHGFALL